MTVLEQAPPNNSSLKTRAKSAAIFAPAALILIAFGGWAFTIMATAMGVIAVYEWAQMVLTGQEAKKSRPLVLLSATLSGFGVMSGGMVNNPLTSFFFLLALCFLVFAFNYAQKGPSPKMLLFGFLYISFSCVVMVWLRGTSGQGLYEFLTLLFIIWASDISAYFTGKTIGGPKLAPAISPKKTWSGFFGSSVGAGFVAAGMACPWMVAHLGVHTMGGMGMHGYFIMGFVLAMFGQAGDLLISVFKRHFGVKDTGNIIPGHGGILDRIDALLFVALLFGSIAWVLG